MQETDETLKWLPSLVAQTVMRAKKRQIHRAGRTSGTQSVARDSSWCHYSCLSGQETRVQSLGGEDSLEKEMEAHSSILA